MVGTSAALVAAAFAVAATATVATAATAAAPVADGGKVITLSADCGGSCQAEVASALTTRGCSDVAMLPTLRIATAVCGARRGRTGRGVDGARAETAALRSLPGVVAVEEDMLEKGEEPLPMDSADAEVPLRGPNGEHYFWGLDRINQFALPLDQASSTSECYPRRGAGVTVWVVDGGCVPDHEEFTPGQVTTRALPSSPFNPAGIDDKGHGSHVAGTVGGWRTGVAPNVTLSCIKVLNSEGRGKRSVIAAGWEAVAAAKVADPTRPMVMQASLSGSGTHFDVAMERLAAVGVIPVVSAGNTGESACDRTPARSPNAITVANSDVDDTLYRSSSRGRCVDVIAPGHLILSVNYRGGLTTMTGTSMAAPHVSGVVALLLAERADGGSLNVRDVKALLTQGAPTVAGWPLGWVSPTCPRVTPPPVATPTTAPTAAPTATSTAAPTTAPTATPTAAPTPTATSQPTPTTTTPAATAAPVTGNPPWGIPPWLAGGAQPSLAPGSMWPTPPWLA